MVCALLFLLSAGTGLASTTQARADSAGSPGAGSPAPTILVMGDSLSAGYGMAPKQSWVSLTAARMATSHPRWRVVNASISGETTTGGAARIDAELRRHRPRIVVIALGGNDGLRGLPLAHTRGNLEKMIRASQSAGAKVLLVGIQLPPNFGRDYTAKFSAVYPSLSKQYRTALLPFILEPIAMDRNKFQPDQIHPTAAAQPLLRDHVWKVLGPMVR